jgi:small redox-active disulfide protein 2
MKDKLKVRVFGIGCAKCVKAEEIVSEFLTEQEVPFEIIKVKDKDEILNSGIMVTPAVEINGEVLFHGRLPRNKELRSWLEKNQ